jgi:hypothetical protein
MGKQPFISHVVNGYSRYDVPESKAFTCTPGILYPVRIDFINARDRVSIEQGIDVRSNPLAVPTFNPYTIRLHRFWVPLQLYHPEMRTNSSKFDMNDLSLNWIPALPGVAGTGATPTVSAPFTNSLLYWLRIANRSINFTTAAPSAGTALPAGTPPVQWSNADTYLAYWDIVRNYYGYSQWGLYSFAWPASWYYTSATTSGSSITYSFNDPGADSFFTQRYGSLEHLDAYFESQFYPSAVPSSNNTYNRRNLFDQIIRSDIESSGSAAGAAGDGYPVISVSSVYSIMGSTAPTDQFAGRDDSKGLQNSIVFNIAHPIAVIPANPDRFSRLLPIGSGSAVSLTGVDTIPQLAIASRLQEYKDLLGAGGSRYSDWLETFFASKIEHVDRPKLLFSASQTVNVQIVMNQAGRNNFAASSNNGALGQQGGAIAFNDRLGRRQSYYFREPGYMIDMLSIRPVYYWSGIRPDYLNYEGSDYFNPIYNDIGYQRVPNWRFNQLPSVAVDSTFAQEPCFNEFRSSYDEVLGQISAVNSNQNLPDLYAYWVQQRYINWTSNWPSSANYAPALFVDMSQVNSPFASNVEDNFFVNLSYAIQKKNLVNKTFATRLSNR